VQTMSVTPNEEELRDQSSEEEENDKFVNIKVRGWRKKIKTKKYKCPQV
jgi:hypothetical protein